MANQTAIAQQAEIVGIYDLCVEIDLAIQLRVLKTAGDVLRYVRARANELESEAMAYKQQRAHDDNIGWDWRQEA